MDPAGPWSAYASYNRLAGVQAGSSSTDLHHSLSTSGGGGTGPPATTTAAQLLPGGFLSPTPVAYETVFSPLFHHATPKPGAHYVSQATQHRALAQAQAASAAASSSSSTKSLADGESYHQAQAFFEQSGNAWQQNSPFGILPHESVVPTTTTKSSAYENFNAHFAAAQSLNHLNSQLAAAKTAATRAQSPQVTTATSKATFFQVPVTFATTETDTNVQQSCIVTSPSTRITQPAVRGFLPSANSLNQRAVVKLTPLQTQIQTKAQTKIYPELGNQTERQRSVDDGQSHASSVSFSIIDAPANRQNYTGSNASALGKRGPQFQQHGTYRHYQNTSNSSEDFQRPKAAGGEYTNNSNGSDCSNVVVPRRPSPLQARSQASPLGHSPAYPIYHSPMSSMSSPQQSSSNNQVAPPSPLDVSVPRPNSQTNALYPSVITRTLNNDKNYPERYERGGQQTNQNVWDERARKFQQPMTAMAANSYNNGNEQRVGVSVGQQPYFDSASGHQVSLQDLSSCRGDPMSIVKNLQQQQVTEVKPDVKVAVKRRKSGDKNDGRVPPPAHSSAGNPQQQNGAYFDFDRWNLPTPAPKFLATQPIHPQHQGLMVPHPHPHPPPLPYFSPFHLAPPHPDFQNSVDMLPSGSYPGSGQHFQQQQHQQLVAEEQPKVVVPNIEEELNFLSQTPQLRSHKATPKVLPASSGFMSSYLKFLQGDRDHSPPPVTRGHRKQSWSNNRTKSPCAGDKPPDVNNGAPVTIVQATPPLPALPPPVITRLSSQGDPQDDPRYFPLPKERKRNSFDSSDDGITSDDDFFSNKKFNLVQTKEKKKCNKSKSVAKRLSKKTHNRSNRPRDILENIPRRESTKRAAKEKSTFHNLAGGDDDIEEPLEFQDSDSDPAWTPQAQSKEDDDDLPLSARKVRRHRQNFGKNKRNLITAAAQGAGIKEIDGYGSDTARKNKMKKQSTPLTLEDNIAASLVSNTAMNDDNPFKVGEFVVIKSELSQQWPAIWRIDGKSLLQKYEPFERDGATRYKNISTYTSWTPESKKQYVPIPVKYTIQSQGETVVEFLRAEMTIIDQEFHSKCMKDSERFQDHFEVYIQTLISQALDTNFLTEIFQEKDEYFLANVRIIDEATDCKKMELLSALKWPPPLQAAVCTWPCFNVIRELNPADVQSKCCAACGHVDVAVRVLMYGQPYNSTTLEGCQPDPKAMNEKNFLMCRMCSTRVELSNKVTHQKYLMYLECAKRVGEKRSSDPNKDTTCILNELLADENWLNQLFYEVRTYWADIDCIKQSFKTKNDASDL